MTAPQTQTISSTRLSGSQTTVFQNTTAPFTNADIVIDRTVNKGLNSLTNADTLTVNFDYSLDGGTTWSACGGATWEGGLLVTKGVTQSQEELAIGIGQPFPIGTAFRIRTVASTPVTIAGTVTYS